MADSDGYTPVTAADVTDLALLPKRFDLFAADVKAQLEVVTKLILPLLTKLRELVDRQGDQIGDHARQLRAIGTDSIQHANAIANIEAKHAEHDQHIAVVRARLAVLELAAVPKPPKRKPRKKANRT